MRTGFIFVLAVGVFAGCATRRMHTSPVAHPNEVHVLAETQRFAEMLGVHVVGVITTQPYMVPAINPRYDGEKVPAAGRYVGGRIEYYRPVIQERNQEYGTALAAHEVCHALSSNEVNADTCASRLMQRGE